MYEGIRQPTHAEITRGLKNMSEKTKVSKKVILPYLERISIIVVSLRKEVESMPESTKRKALMLSVENIEKKTAIQVKEASEDEVMQYVNKHPEVLQKLAKFAASDEGAKEISSEVVTSEDIQKDEQKEQPKKKKRF